MWAQVKDVSENPLARRRQLSHAQKGGPLMETRILENAINKICALLAIGFGDAGAEVSLLLHFFIRTGAVSRCTSAACLLSTVSCECSSSATHAVTACLA